MNSDLSVPPTDELEAFVRQFLRSRGAVLEAHGDFVEALLPETLAAALDTPEEICISPNSADEGERTYRVHFGSPLLDRMLSLVCSTPPLTRCRLEIAYLKSQGFNRLIEDQFALHGAVGRVESQARIHTEYLFLACRYLAQSDEQQEGVLDLVFNLESGAFVPEMVTALDSVSKTYESQGPSSSPAPGEIESVLQWVGKQAEEQLHGLLGPFRESMDRRLRRDVRNLKEYYDSLNKEMEQSLKRPGISPQAVEDRRAKMALLPGEMSRKEDDLFKKYSIRVKIAPAAAMRIKTPAVKILFNAAIGRKTRNLSFVYNPVTKALDPLVCQGCGTSTTRLHFCHRLHLLCSACRLSCPACRQEAK